MKQVELALPEYLCQVLEEVRKNLLHAGSVMLLPVDQLIDILSCAESVRPDAHRESYLQLVVSELQHFLESIFLIETDGEGDLRLHQELWVLRLLQDLVEVVVNGLSHTLVLDLVLVLGTEIEDSLRSLVIKVDHLGVLSQGVEDNLAHIYEEQYARHQILLSFHCLVVAVCQEHQFFWVKLSDIP